MANQRERRKKIDVGAAKHQIRITPREAKSLADDVNAQFLKSQKILLEGRAAQLCAAALSTLSYLIGLLAVPRMSVIAIRKLLGILAPPPDDPDKGISKNGSQGDPAGNGETSNDSPKSAEPSAEDNTDTQSSADEGEEANEDTPAELPIDPKPDSMDDATKAGQNEPLEPAESGPGAQDSPAENELKPAAPGHGRRPDCTNLPTTQCFHGTLKSGDPCPLPDCNGKVYPFLNEGEPRTLLVFDCHADFEGEKFVFNDLRCNVCKAVFKAELPESALIRGVQREKKALFTIRAIAMLLVGHYFYGRSFRSIDTFGSLLGSGVAKATQFDQIQAHAEALAEVVERIWVQRGANAPIIYGDDISARLMSIAPKIMPSRNGNHTCREGTHTTILIAVDAAGNAIPIYTTGLSHLGEVADDLLQDRKKGLPPPVLIADRSKSNVVMSTDVVSAGCLQHARDRFVKAQKNYPQECDEILQALKKIFKVDQGCKDLSPVDRTKTLTESALPYMINVLALTQRHLAAKIATPKSEMGDALSYFEKHFDTFLLPFKVPGVALTNNLSEWMTYPVVRYFNNSRHYKTPNGAKIGDTAMTLTMLSLLNGKNPVEYLTYLLNTQSVAKDAGPILMPWELSDRDVKAIDPKWYTHWIPVPGQNPCPSDEAAYSAAG